MNTLMNVKTITLLMLLPYIDVSASAKLTVYRWVDENNIVHFSQNQPTHDNYVATSVTNGKSRSTTGSTIMGREKSPDNPVPKNQLQANSKQQSTADESMCKTARDNIKTLQNFDKIQYKDTNDNAKILTVLEKKQQLAMNKKQAEVYCHD